MTVFLIGFTHRLTFDGIAIYDSGSFRTPLGDVLVDGQLAAAIKSESRRIISYPEAFDEENSVEMQIPFIQVAMKGASVVPIAFGTQDFTDAEALAGALALALKDRDDYLIVASTDLSHYHAYDEASAIDKRMIALLDTKKAKELYDEARLGMCELCGIMPVTATLLTADKLGFGDVKVLKYANSGDTFGDKSRVVGYLSAAIYKPDASTEGELAMLNEAQRTRLLQIARESIISYVKEGKEKSFSEKDPVLNEPMGAFVTLHDKGELRGCIGNMVGQGPLYQTVADMAIQAATGDPRFPVLSPSEIDKVDIEISVLSPMKKVSGPEEIRVPGHGVVVRRGSRSGVYLPQVATETGWGREQFLTSLCSSKAGLAPDAWKDPATDMYVFSAEVFGEKPASTAGGRGAK
jgi:AmmeMemoRadiSam system protein B/AmmeMemoRadiSam system protein A